MNTFPILVSALLVTLCCTLSAQQNFLVVDNIQIDGLNKTKKYIVQRELDFQKGDTIWLPNLSNRLEENKKRVLNTALFNIVNINIVNWDTDNKKADIHFDLIEAWYIYPIPIFELADRNFNVWWNEQGRSLSRVNYGLSLEHINLTGRKDHLKLKFQQGFTHKYEAKYIYPYLDRNRKWGLEAHIFFSTNKEISYITIGNKPQFIKAEDERILLRRFRVGAKLTHRNGLYTHQSIKLEYHHNQVDEIIANANPDYFLDGEQDLKFLLLEYKLALDKRQFNIYPDDGYLIEFIAKKEGFGLLGKYNNLPISLKYAIYKQPWSGWILANIAKAKTNITRSQLAFANNTGLGYENDYIKGYELYVQDGTDYIYNHSYISFKCFDKLLNLSKFMAINEFKLMSLKIYLRIQTQLGYVNESHYLNNNIQNNRLLIGYGPALDILMYNNFLFQIEYTYNHLQESGLYIRSAISF